MKNLVLRATIAVATLLVTACDSASDGGNETDAGLRFGTPLSAERQALYMQSCHLCHRNDVPGIPRAGDPQDWEKRKQQGLDVLVRHAIRGNQGMPPMGLCQDCTQEDMRALVAYMAGIDLVADSSERSENDPERTQQP